MFKREISVTFLISFYIFSTQLWGESAGAVAAYSHVIWFLESFVISYFILSVFADFFTEKKWENLIVLVGTIAAVITLFLILNPSLNEYVRSNVIIETLDTVSESEWSFRGFSVAESSAYSYGIVQGLVLALCLFKVKDSPLYILPILLLFVSILFNARIGFVPAGFALALILFSGKIKLKSLVLLVLILFLGEWLLYDSAFSEQNESSLTWGLNFFSDTLNMVKGEDDGSNYTVLFNEMLFFPETLIGFLFGEGKDLFGLRGGTDIGYILQLFKGGIVYLLLLLCFLWFLFKRSYKYSENKFIPILFFITILIVNIKGNAFFLSNGFFRLFISYYVYIIFSQRNINADDSIA